MKNIRQDRSLLYNSLIARFGWIKSVAPYMGPHYPSSEVAYSIELSQLCRKIKDFQGEKQRFDAFIKEYFGIPQWRNQVVTLWNEGHIVVVVFK